MKTNKEKSDAARIHGELYELFAKAIASVDEKYQADLCRDFRINPNYVNDCRKNP